MDDRERRILDHYAQLTQLDAEANRRWCGTGDRVLLVRHPERSPGFYLLFLRWLETNFPAVRGHFQLALLPCASVDLSGVRLVVPWLQDPVEAWSPKSLPIACRLVDRCTALGIPVVNHPARLVNAGKRETAARLAAIGIRTPRIVAIDPADPEAARREIAGPMLVREDWQHGAASLRLAPGEPIDAAALGGFQRPIAVEFVDTRGADGLFRKYRVLVAGDHTIAVHLIASREWEVRGDNKVTTADLLAEEAAHIATEDANGGLLARARRALELDFAAFDYGRLRDGRMVVWEANPYPLIQFGPREAPLKYRDAPVHRSFAAMAGLYLDRAGLPVPADIDALRRYGVPDTQLVLDRLLVLMPRPKR